MQVEKTMDNAQKCLCLSCPSYTKNCKIKNNLHSVSDVLKKENERHWEMMFCAFEKSNCIHENRGCMCQTCPIHKKYALNNEDYCLHTGGVF